jgi:hypothetical protein
MGDLLFLDCYRDRLRPLDLCQCAQCFSFFLTSDFKCPVCRAEFQYLPDVEYGPVRSNGGLPLIPFLGARY